MNLFILLNVVLNHIVLSSLDNIMDLSHQIVKDKIKLAQVLLLFLVDDL